MRCRPGVRKSSTTKKHRSGDRQDRCWGKGTGMARGNRRRHPRADGNHERDAAPTDGPDDGCLGGADQIAERVVGDAVEAEVYVSLQRDDQLARCGLLANESVRTLHAGRATVAKGMDGRYGPLDETLNARTQFERHQISRSTASRVKRASFPRVCL